MSFSSRPISLWRLPSLPLQGEDARWQKGVAIFTDSEFLRFRRLFGNVDAARAALNEHEKFARILRYFLGDEGPRLTAFRPPKISGLLAQHSTRRHFPLKLGGREDSEEASKHSSEQAESGAARPSPPSPTGPPRPNISQARASPTPEPPRHRQQKRVWRSGGQLAKLEEEEEEEEEPGQYFRGPPL